MYVHKIYWSLSQQNLKLCYTIEWYTKGKGKGAILQLGRK